MEFAVSVEFHKLSSFFWNIISFDKSICSEDTIFKCYIVWHLFAFILLHKELNYLGRN